MRIKHDSFPGAPGRLLPRHIHGNLSAKLRRASKSARLYRSRFGIDEAFDFNRVLPAVAEIIEVAKRLGADVFENRDELRLARVERTAGLVWIWNTPAGGAGADLIEVAVGPAHRRLSRQM